MNRKLVSIGLSLTTMVWLVGASFPIAGAATTAELQAQIAALLQQIQTLQAQLNTAGTGTVTSSFTRNLTVGSKGTDVSALQQVLINGGFLKVAAPTAFFGPMTKTALVAWQKAHSVSPASGYFGPLTRTAMGGAAGTTTGGTTGPVVVVPSGTDLVVSLAADTPGAKTLGSGTAFNPSLKVNLTAGSKTVNVTGVTLQKTGFVANTNLNGVDIVDASGVRHGNVITSINADNTIGITFPTAPITVAAGQSTSFLVRFNLLTGNYNGTVGFSVAAATSITADTTSISGSFPITGSAMNIVNGGSSLASTTLDVLTSTGSSTLNVDPNNWQEITRFRIKETSSNEGVYLWNLTLYNYGNAGAGDYGSVQLLDQSLNVLATANPVGQNVTFSLANPFFIDKGQTKDFTVKAKLLGGTTKTVQLVVYNNYDIDLRGSATGVSVIPGAGTNDTSFPIGNGFNIQTIGSGMATLSRTTDSPSNAITPGASSVVLAKYSFKPTGENMELRQVSFYIASSTTAGSHALSGTVYVKVNGAIVYSTGASNVSATAASTFTLSTYAVATQGQDNFITIETSIPTTATAVDTYQVKAFDIIQVKRLVTNDLLDPSTAATDGIALAVKAAALSVITLAQPTANSVVVGTNAYNLARVQLNSQAGGEDVNVTKIVVTDTMSGGTDYSGVTNLVMYNGDPSAGGTALNTTGSTAANAATVTFNFATPILVARANPVTLYITGNVASSTFTNITHTYNVASSTSALTATGKDTGNSLTNGSDITFAGNGQAQTVVTNGNLTVSLVSGAGASPSTAQTTQVGVSQGTWFAFKLSSQYETQKITSLKLTATSSGSTGLSTSTLMNVKLYQDQATTPFAQASQFASCAAGTCTLTFPSTGTVDNLLSAAVPVTGTTIYVKADIGGGGVADLGNSFKLSIASTSDITVKGSVSASTTGTVTGTPTASAFTFVVPQSVVVNAISPSAATQVGTSAGQTVGVFQVVNNGTAPILLSTSTLSFTNGGAATTTTSFKIYASVVGGGQNDTSGWNSGNGYAATTGTTGASSTISFATTTITAAEQQIDGGSWRYFTIKTTTAVANNDTFQFSVSALGNVLFNSAESSLGYSGNPSTNSNLTETIMGLYTSGTPALQIVTAKT